MNRVVAIAYLWRMGTRKPTLVDEYYCDMTNKYHTSRLYPCSISQPKNICYGFKNYSG